MKKLFAVLMGIFVCIPGPTIAYNSETEDTLFGVWDFMGEIESSISGLGLAPFPTKIMIESIGEEQGKLTLKLPSQSKDKIYLFSKTEPTTVKVEQLYDNHGITGQEPYTLIEVAAISYSSNVLEVDLKWIVKQKETQSSISDSGSYSFSLSDEAQLVFIRTNGDKNFGGPDYAVFKALYGKAHDLN